MAQSAGDLISQLLSQLESFAGGATISCEGQLQWYDDSRLMGTKVEKETYLEAQLFQMMLVPGGVNVV